MSDSVKIVGTPYEEGQTKKQVRSELRAAFPGYRVASILRDDENERWLAHLIEQSDQVHHKLAEDDEKAPFPLKELGPSGDDDSDEESDSDSDDDSDSSDEESKDDKSDDSDEPAEDKGGDEKAELGDVLKQFKKLLPALEKLVGPVPDEEGPPHPDDVGPVPGNGGPGLPPGPPGPGGPPPGGPPGAAPPRRAPMPPGAGRRPTGPPRPGVPTFTHAQELPLQRTADVTEDEAKAELLAAYPDYEIREFANVNGLYKVILEKKSN